MSTKREELITVATACLTAMLSNPSIVLRSDSGRISYGYTNVNHPSPAYDAVRYAKELLGYIPDERA